MMDVDVGGLEASPTPHTSPTDQPARSPTKWPTWEHPKRSGCLVDQRSRAQRRAHPRYVGPLYYLVILRCNAASITGLTVYSVAMTELHPAQSRSAAAVYCPVASTLCRSSTTSG